MQDISTAHYIIYISRLKDTKGKNRSEFYKCMFLIAVNPESAKLWRKKNDFFFFLFLHLIEFRTGKTQLSHTLCGKCATLKWRAFFFFSTEPILYHNIKIQHIKASWNCLSLEIQWKRSRWLLPLLIVFGYRTHVHNCFLIL